jgi:ABC-type bacteriocin/lantibiotic exporter with double-glycine peptidase domain
MEDVGFGYDPDIPVLKDAALKVEPGCMVGIIGPTGSGKTSLFRLLLGLLSPERGYLYLVFPGEGILPLSPATRGCFSYVPQGNTVMSGTIEENLRLGNLLAGEEDMKTCLEQACLWEYVKSLPLGLKTRVGEKGTNLSEGQAQRLAIARALLKEAPILLLDEATSALDPDTEARVLASIRQGAKTCLFITHRMVVHDICDKVYRIQDGYVKECG